MDVSKRLADAGIWNEIKQKLTGEELDQIIDIWQKKENICLFKAFGLWINGLGGEKEYISEPSNGKCHSIYDGKPCCFLDEKGRCGKNLPNLDLECCFSTNGMIVWKEK